ncbi:MAG TPA: LacI family DNA-binding transcriptional regulator [Chthoniobacteraceae bacterium]|nr:LacI family DNA-binding transcriptional regulator [Chthoniobacteraceae bacterium]
MNREPKVTVADVAAAAGVSPSTVSRALRNHSDIPPATCERIQALAETMGYRPDPLISALLARRFQKTGAEIGTIAYVTTFSTREGWRYGFFGKLFEGAREQALKRGYLIEPFWLKEPKMTGRRLSEILVSRGIRGLLVPPLERAYGHLRLQWERFSCATIGYSMIRPSLHRATPHHFHNTLLALRTLRQAGFRRIGVSIPAETNRKVGENFLAAALFYQRRYGERSLLIFVSNFKTGDELRRGIREWIDRERPDCIFGPHNIEAMGCLRPGDPLLVGQGGSGIGCNYPHIDEKPRLVGAAAVDLIIGQIQRNETGVPVDPKVVMVEGKWVDPTQRVPAN